MSSGRLRDRFKKHVPFLSRSNKSSPARDQGPDPPTTPGILPSGVDPQPSKLPALEKAWQRLDDETRQAFIDAYKQESSEKLLAEAKLRASDRDLLDCARGQIEWHKGQSRTAASADKISTGLTSFKNFISTFAPLAALDTTQITSLVLGGVNVVLKVALEYFQFFVEISATLAQFMDYLEPIHRFTKTELNFDGDALANVYGDLLEFCCEVRKFYQRRSPSLNVFFHSFLGIELPFKSIEGNLKHHRDVLSLSAQGFQLERETEQERANFLEWVSSVHFETIYDKTLSRRSPGTAEWIFSKSEFTEWRNGVSSPSLWCYGGPGRGKSVLASNVVQHLQNYSDKDVAIAFAFCRHDQVDTTNTTHIVRALIKQLCCHLPILPRWIMDFYSRYHGNNEHPPLSMLLETLKHVLEEFTHAYLVLDGLDECSPDDLNQLLEAISETANSVPHLRMFVTSRPEVEIKDHFERLSVPTMKIEADTVADDIRRLVEDYIQNGKLKIHEDVYNQMKTKIVETLTERSNGMFLWVDLQLRSLSQGIKRRNEAAVLDELQNLPQDLDQAYARMLDGILDMHPSAKALALKALSWVLYSTRPLYTSELRFGLSVCPDSNQHSSLSPYDMEEILDACNGFIETRPSREDGESHLETVHMLHFSAQEFLEKADSARSVSTLQSERAHQSLSASCLWYLALDIFAEGYSHGRDWGNCFAIYATSYFDAHLHKAHVGSDLLELVQKLSRSCHNVFGAILTLRGKCENEISGQPPESAQANWDALLYSTELHKIPDIHSRHDTITAEELPNTLAWVCWLGDEAGLEAILHQVKDFDFQYHKGLRNNLLERVISSGNEDLIRFFLECGTHATYDHDLGEYSVDCARVRPETLALLLKHGMDPNNAYGFETTLGTAVIAGYGEHIRILIEHGADINRPNYFGVTPVGVAMGYHEEDISIALGELLISLGARTVPSDDGTGRMTVNPVTLAARHGKFRAMRFLLNKGADVNSLVKKVRTPLERSPLHAAIMAGSLAGVQMLLELGADVNSVSDFYGPPLYVVGKWGAALGPEGVLKVSRLLLEHGAEVNLMRKGGETALVAMAGAGCYEAVKLLLEHKATVHTISDARPESRAALHAAARAGRRDIVELLLEHGADVNVIGKDGTPLHAAAASDDSVRMVELLLQRGARTDLVPESSGITALHEAARKAASPKTVELLLEHHRGSHVTEIVNSTVPKEGTPLHLVVQAEDYEQRNGKAVRSRGQYDIVRLLLDHGADVNVCVEGIGSPVESALMKKWVPVDLRMLQLLLERGADVSVHGCKALHYAALLEDIDLARNAIDLLLAHGADINAVNVAHVNSFHRLEGTVLQTVIENRGSIALVELLLDRGADPNVVDGGKYGTALRAARFYKHRVPYSRGKPDYERLLLERGAVEMHLASAPDYRRIKPYVRPEQY